MNLLPDELVIDNFAGGGGASAGIEAAFCALIRIRELSGARA